MSVHIYHCLYRSSALRKELATIVVVEGSRRINGYILRDCQNSRRRLSGSNVWNVLSVRLHPPLDLIAQICLYPTWVDEGSCDVFMLGRFQANLLIRNVRGSIGRTDGRPRY